MKKKSDGNRSDAAADVRSMPDGDWMAPMGAERAGEVTKRDFNIVHPYMDDHVTIERQGEAFVVRPLDPKIRGNDQSVPPQTDITEHLRLVLSQFINDNAAQLKQCPALIMDCSQQDFVGSEFIGALIKLKKALDEKGARLMIVATPQFKLALETTCTNEFFGLKNIVASLTDAQRSLKNSSQERTP